LLRHPESSCQFRPEPNQRSIFIGLDHTGRVRTFEEAAEAMKNEKNKKNEILGMRFPLFCVLVCVTRYYTIGAETIGDATRVLSHRGRL